MKDMLPMEICPYPRDRRENKRTDVHVKYVEMCILQKLWDSSDSLNGNSCVQKLTFIRSTTLIISGDFFNTLECDHRGKGKGK